MKNKLPPGPRGLSVFKIIKQMRNGDRLEIINQLRKQYGDTIFFGFPVNRYVIFNPDHVKWVFQENSKNYTKISNGLRVIFGNGLVTSVGKEWTAQRRLMNPEFSMARVESYSDIMVNRSKKFVEELTAKIEKEGNTFNIADSFMEMTFLIAGECLFGNKINAYAAQTKQLMATAGKAVAERHFNSFIRLPLWIPTKNNRIINKSSKLVDAIVYPIIDEYLKNPENLNENNLLSRLVKAKMPRNEIRDQMITLMIASHETTAHTLSWAIYCLAKNPDKKQKVYDEIISAIGNETIQFGDLEKMPYLKAAWQETLRLFSVTPALIRRAIGNDVFGGYKIKKNYEVVCSPFLLHRDPRHWDVPMKYTPERFLDQKFSPYVYAPFGIGPRKCIGYEFSMIEVQIILATLLQAFDFELQAGFEPKMEIGVTLGPKSMMVKLIPRTKKEVMINKPAEDENNVVVS